MLGRLLSIVVNFDKLEEMNMNQESSRAPEPGTREGAQEAVKFWSFQAEKTIFWEAGVN